MDMNDKFKNIVHQIKQDAESYWCGHIPLSDKGQKTDAYWASVLMDISCKDDDIDNIPF